MSNTFDEHPDIENMPTLSTVTELALAADVVLQTGRPVPLSPLATAAAADWMLHTFRRWAFSPIGLFVRDMKGPGGRVKAIGYLIPRIILET